MLNCGFDEYLCWLKGKEIERGWLDINVGCFSLMPILIAFLLF